MGKLIKWIVIGVVLVLIIVGGMVMLLSSKNKKTAPIVNVSIPKPTQTAQNPNSSANNGGNGYNNNNNQSGANSANYGNNNTSSGGRTTRMQARSMTLSPNAIEENVLPGIPNEKRVTQLATAPIQKVNQVTDIGNVPVIAKDGSKPWRLYAKPYKFKNKRAKVALVMGPIGLAKTQFKLAIDKMPLETTFILSPYAHSIATKSQMIRMKGHEFLLEFPTESGSYDNDSGPQTLKHTQNPTQLLDSINVLLATTSGYIGAGLMYGDSFVSNRSKLHIIVSELNSRGLLTFDDGSAGSRSALKVLAVKATAPYAMTDQSLKSNQTTAEVNKKLKTAYNLLSKGKNQIILLEPQPRLMEIVLNWIKLHGGQRTSGNFELVPLSSISSNRN